MRRAAEAVKYNHPYRKYVDTILKKCPDEFVKSLRRNDDYVEYNESDVSIPTEKALIKMHLNIISVREAMLVTMVIALMSATVICVWCSSLASTNTKRY